MTGPYQFDEQGYEALRGYLEHAEAQLGGNPDVSEIVRSLEQSIAENCRTQRPRSNAPLHRAQFDGLHHKAH